MSKRFLLLLLVAWNLLLTGAVAWSLARPRVPDRILQQKLGDARPSADEERETQAPVRVRNTDSIPDARIAFFLMDSITEKFVLVKESAAKVRSEGQRMEGNFQRELQKAQARYEELMTKDHTYSTQAELRQDQAEVEELTDKIQRLQVESQDRFDALQRKMLVDITEQIQDFLKEFNATAGYDYIFSVQDAGQIWVGNESLDITDQLVDGLNAKHRERQGAKAK